MICFGLIAIRTVLPGPGGYTARRTGASGVAAGDRERLAGGQACDARAVGQPELSPRTAQGGLGHEGEFERVEERLLCPLPRGIDLVQSLRRRSGRELRLCGRSGTSGHLRQEGHASLCRSAAPARTVMGCGPQARQRPSGWRATKPLVDRIVFCQREPSIRWPEVSNRMPADLHEDVARARPRRDPLAAARLAPAHQRPGGHRPFDQAGVRRARTTPSRSSRSPCRSTCRARRPTRTACGR